MKGGNERGFNYWKLNYKAKFRRTVWMIPITLLVIVAIIYIPVFPKAMSYFLIAMLIIVLLGQLIYTYYKWKEEEKETA